MAASAGLPEHLHGHRRHDDALGDAGANSLTFSKPGATTFSGGAQLDLSTRAITVTRGQERTRSAGDRTAAREIQHGVTGAISSGFTSLALGNGEGIITVTSDGEKCAIGHDLMRQISITEEHGALRSCKSKLCIQKENRFGWSVQLPPRAARHGGSTG